MGYVKKRLVYYMWIPKDGLNKFHELHFACLERYAKVFDESNFFLAVDDISNLDYDFIRKIEERLLEIGFVKNVTFKIIENNGQYREGKVFKEEIVDKLDELDGITFFAHTKGVSTHWYGEKSNAMWVAAMYYFNLEYVDEMVWWLTETINNSYGFFRMYDPSSMGHIANNWMYAGTFMWLNCQKISQYIESFKVKVPSLYDKGYAEDFIGNTTKWEFSSSKGGWTNGLCDLYRGCAENLKLYFESEEKEEYKGFFDFFNTIYDKKPESPPL